MFGKATEAAGGAGRHTQSVLQEGVTVRGEVEAIGDFRLDGRVEGKLVVSERLTIGSGGSLVAEVVAGEVIVMGDFEGKIFAHRRLELRKGARVVADLTCPSLIIEEGVHFQGNSNMRLDSIQEAASISTESKEPGLLETVEVEDLKRAYR